MRCRAMNVGGGRCCRAATVDGYCGPHAKAQAVELALDDQDGVNRSWAAIVRLLSPRLDSLDPQRVVAEVRRLLHRQDTGGEHTDYSLRLVDGRVVPVRRVWTSTGGECRVLSRRPTSESAYHWVGAAERNGHGAKWLVRWDGRPDEEPFRCDSLSEAIRVLVERWHRGHGLMCADCEGVDLAPAVGSGADAYMVDRCEACGASGRVRWALPALRAKL